MRITIQDVYRRIWLAARDLYAPVSVPVPLTFHDGQPQPITIKSMPKIPVVILHTHLGHEIITKDLRCAALCQSEYEAHLFLHKYRDTYKVYNTTSAVGQSIAARYPLITCHPTSVSFIPHRL